MYVRVHHHADMYFVRFDVSRMHPFFTAHAEAGLDSSLEPRGGDISI